MVNFIESATLRLNPQALQQTLTGIGRLNKSLRTLDRTAAALRTSLARISLFNNAELRRASRELGRVQAQLQALRAQAARPIVQRVVTRQTGAAGAAGARGGGVVPPVPVVPAGGGRRGGFGGGFRVGGSTGFGGGLRFGAASILVIGTVHIGGKAISAALEGQRADAAINTTITDPLTRQIIRDASVAAVASTRRITSTRADEIALDVYRGGVRGADIGRLTTELAGLESRAGLISPGLDTSTLTVLANKVLNLGNALEDTERQSELLTGTFGAAVAAGESFRASEFLSALRVSGFATSISEEGLIGLGLLVDAAGRRAGEGLQRLRKELQTPLSQAGAGGGIAKGSVEALIAAGLRTEQGLTPEQVKAFETDPMAYIQNVLAKRIQSSGIDLEDRAALRTYLAQSGFNQTSQRVLLDALTSILETQRAREVARGITHGQEFEDQITNNMPAALENLSAAFSTLSRSVLTPLFERWAPGVTALGDSIFNLARWFDDLSEKSKDLFASVTAISAGIAGVAGLAALLRGLRSLVFAGPNLLLAAKELQVAAGRLAVGGAAGAAGGAGRGRGRLRTPPIFGTAGLLGGFFAATAAQDILRGGTALNGGEQEFLDRMWAQHHQQRGTLWNNRQRPRFAINPTAMATVNDSRTDRYGRVLSNVPSSGNMIMRAADWAAAGETMGDSFTQKIMSAGESLGNLLADKIRYAIDSASIQVGGISAATMGDVGLSVSGDGGDSTFGATASAGGYYVGS